jgi:hypothetical protein
LVTCDGEVANVEANFIFITLEKSIIAAGRYTGVCRKEAGDWKIGRWEVHFG